MNAKNEEKRGFTNAKCFLGTVTKFEMTKFEKGDDKPQKFVLPNHCFVSDQLQLVKMKNNFEFRI